MISASSPSSIFMTARELLNRRARLIYFLPLFASLPGIMIVALSLGGSRAFGAIGVWFANYWWALLVTLIVSTWLVKAGFAFMLRCPWCNFRFGSAEVSAFVFPEDARRINFCMHCGHSLDETKAQKSPRKGRRQ